MLMLDCGAVRCGSLEFLSPFPLPLTSVDQSDFDELPVEERLSITHRNLQQVRETLRLKQSDYEDLQQEMKFHAIKNEELMDVVNAFRSSSADRSRDIMRAKAEQNSELTLQVHALRDLLTKSGEEVADLQKKLKETTAEGERLTADQRCHKHLRVQLDDLAKSLESMDVDGADDEVSNEWLNFKSLLGAIHKKGGDNNAPNNPHSETIDAIRRKITALDADRQRLLKESRFYGISEGDKERTIRDLEQKVQAHEHETSELTATNQELKEQLAVREGKIGALEELFQNINANRTLNARANPDRSLFEADDDDDDDDDDDRENYEDVDSDSIAGDSNNNDNKGGVAQSFEEMFVNIWTSVTGGSPTNGAPASHADDAASVSASACSSASSTDAKDRNLATCLSSDSYHTKQVEEELEAAARQEFRELRERYQTLAKDHESAQSKISDLTTKLRETTARANSFQKKAGLREVMLKDVIQQYKNLQAEHSEAIDRVEELQNEVGVLSVQLRDERELRREQKQTPETLDPSGTAKAYPTEILVEGEAATVDLSVRTDRTAQQDEDVDTDAAQAALVENENANENANANANEMANANALVVQCLETECDRLQHEFDTAIDKINELEESLEKARAEARESMALRVDQAVTIARMEAELEASALAATATATATATSPADEQSKTEDAGESQMAREKQLQRERDLWEVIEQYKQLVEQNESTKAGANEEVELTEKVTIQRRDLVYEYRKLEKTLEEAVENGQQLAEDLESAQYEAAEHKKETQGIRKKLAGCHSHYKQLQEQYESVVQENEELDRRLSEALQIEQQLASLSNDNENEMENKTE